MDSFEKRLSDNFDSLTKSHQTLARYLLDNINSAVFMTALDIAKTVSLSETTIIRLSYKLGYDSFSSMHKAMRSSVLINRNKEVSSGLDGVEEAIKALSDKHQEYLRRTFNNFYNEFLESICDELMNAESVLVMGYKDSYGVAVEFMRLLEKIRPRVYFHRWMRDRNDIVYDIVRDSLMVAVSFSPHSRFTVTETEFMKKVGCKIIAFTDTIVNPFRYIANFNPILDVPRDDITGFINTSPAIGLFDYIAKYMYGRYRDRIDHHIKHSRKYYDYDEYV